MKKTALLTSALFALLAFSSCGGNKNSNESSSLSSNNDVVSNESTVSNSTSSEEVNVNEVNYVVKVVYEDGTPVLDSKISGQLCNDSNCFAFKLGNDGSASKKLAKDNYTVHIFNLPDGYTYNPNVYNVSAENSETTIVLYHVKSFLSGNGEKYTAYEMNEGVYMCTPSANNEVFYFFTPTRPGVYTIESMSESLDTVINFYGGNKNFIADDYLASDDNSGEGLNFKYEFTIENEYFVGTDAVDENGNIVLETDENGNCIPGSSYVFGISVKDAPATLDPFAIKVTYEHEYVPPVITTTVVEPQATLTQFADNTDYDTSIKNVLLDGSYVVVYNENDGYYHIGDANGPTLLVNLNYSSQYLDRAICYLEMEGGNAFTFVTSETERENYTSFVASYSSVCNSDGVYPVTKEMKEFLTKLKDSEHYFADFGWIKTQIDYEIDSDSEWMFACCYYGSTFAQPVSGNGSADEPYNLELGNTYKCVVSGNPTYFTLYTIGECVVDIRSFSPNVTLTYDGFTAGIDEFGFDFTLYTEGRTPYTFTIATEDGTESEVIFEIVYHQDDEPVGGRDNIIYGNNVIDIASNEAVSGVSLTYVAPVTAKYYFNPDEATCLWYELYGESITINGSEYDYLYVELEEGETFTFFVGREDLSEGTATFYMYYVEDLEIESDFVIGDNSISYSDGQYDEWNGFSGYYVTLQAGDYKFTVGEGTAASIDWMYMLSSDEPSVTISLKYDYPVAIYLTNTSGETEGNLLLNIEYLGPTVYENDYIIGENTFHYENGEDAMWNGFSGHFVIESTGSYTFTVAEGTAAFIDDGWVSQMIPDEGNNSLTLYLFEGDVISISLTNNSENTGEGDLVITVEFDDNGGENNVEVTEAFTLGSNS